MNNLFWLMLPISIGFFCGLFLKLSGKIVLSSLILVWGTYYCYLFFFSSPGLGNAMILLLVLPFLVAMWITSLIVYLLLSRKQKTA